MSKLIIEVECGEKVCAGCRYHFLQYCAAFIHNDGQWTWLEPVSISGCYADRKRCPACLAAEEKLNAIERRYAELVETTAARTDQAKREK